MPTPGMPHVEDGAERKADTTEYPLGHIPVRNLPDVFPPGTHLRIWNGGGESYEGIVGSSGATGNMLEFLHGSDPDTNPLHKQPIAELQHIDKSTYRQERGADDKYNGTFFRVTLEGEGKHPVLIEKLPGGKVIDEKRRGNW